MHHSTHPPNALEGTSEPRPRAAERRFRQSPPPKELVSGLEFNKGHIVGSAEKLSSKVSATFHFYFLRVAVALRRRTSFQHGQQRATACQLAARHRKMIAWRLSIMAHGDLPCASSRRVEAK